MDIDAVQLGRAVLAASAGWTQKRLEEVTGIPQPRISAIQRGYRNERATLEEILKIEEAVGLPHGYILTLAGVVTVEGAQRGAEAAARRGSNGDPKSGAPR